VSFWKKVRGAVRILAALAPLLKILGVKPKTVAGKLGQAAQEIDSALPSADEPNGSKIAGLQKSDE
jgi:hypothetical protein